MQPAGKNFGVTWRIGDTILVVKAQLVALNMRPEVKMLLTLPLESLVLVSSLS